MRSRLVSVVSCLILTTACLADVHAANLAQQRQYYDEAKRALAKGDSGPYRRYEAALRDYPLTPYLAYDELTYRLKSASNAEIEKFLADGVAKGKVTEEAKKTTLDNLTAASTFA